MNRSNNYLQNTQTTNIKSAKPKGKLGWLKGISFFNQKTSQNVTQKSP
jgi:hypothetical protein